MDKSGIHDDNAHTKLFHKMGGGRGLQQIYK